MALAIEAATYNILRAATFDHDTAHDLSVQLGDSAYRIAATMDPDNLNRAADIHPPAHSTLDSHSNGLSGCGMPH